MQSWKKARFMHRFILLLLFLYIQVHQAFAAQITISELESKNESDAYFISAKFNINFNDEILEALIHGIPLTFNIELQTKAKHNWLPDQTITSSVISHQLLYQPLTDDYLTINLKTGVRTFYDTLAAASLNIGHLKNQKLVDSYLLVDDLEYNGLVRMYLDRDKLPSPMRPQAYFSDKWQLETEWHKWKIKK